MPSIIELGAPDRKNGDLTVTGDSNALLSLLKDQISEFPPGKQYGIAIKEVPVTVERLPYYPKEGDRLQDPGTARANIAVSNESPNGTSQDDWAQKHQHQTVGLCNLFVRQSALLNQSSGCTATCRLLGQGSRWYHLASRHLQRLSRVGLEPHSLLARDFPDQCQPFLSYFALLVSRPFLPYTHLKSPQGQAWQ